MAIQILNEEVIRKYLLGLLPESEAVHVEERWLTSDDSYEELLAAEADLIDDYLGNKLNQDERERFLSRFLVSEERREKLRFSQAFRAVVAKQSSPQVSDSREQVNPKTSWYEWFLPGTPRFVYALGAIVMAVVLGISFIAYRNSRSPVVVEKSVFVVSLRPGLTRGGDDLQRITIPEDKNVVRFQVEAGGNRKYRAELISEGKSVLVTEDLTAASVADRTVVDVDIPREKLPAGDYRLRLSSVTNSGALEPESTYAFRIVR